MGISVPGFKKKEEKSISELLLGYKQNISHLKDAIAPGVVKEEEDYVRLGDNYVRTIVATDYKREVKKGWMAPLYRFKGNITITRHLIPTSGEKLIQELSASIEELEERVESARTSPKRKIEAKFELDSATELLTKLLSGNENAVFFVHLYILIQAESLEELDFVTQKLKNAMIPMGLKPMAIVDNALKAFEANLPLLKNTCPEMTIRNMDAESAAAMFPYDESEIMHPTGIIKGRNMTTDSLVLVDQWSLKNQNEFVIGTSGAGKTFYLKKDMLRHFQDGVQIYIIDPEREYKRLIKKIGGQIITISSMSETIINPLEIMHSNIDLLMDDKNDDQENDEEMEFSPSLLHQKIMRVKTFFKMIKRDLTPIEAAKIEDLLIKTYRDCPANITWNSDFSKLTSKDYPILGDLYKKVEDAVRDGDRGLEDFMAVLKTYVDGSNSLMFNGHTNVTLNNEVICFDLKELDEESEVQPAAMYNVLSFLWDEITKDNVRRKRLYVDEAHIMADPDNPRAMKFLFNIYKRIRKYRGGCTSATQQLADFLTATEGRRNYGKAVIGNSQSKMLLSMEEQDIEDIKKHKVLRISDTEVGILSTDKKGEGIYIVGKKRAHVQIDHTPYEMSLIDPVQYEEKYGKGRIE